MHNSFDKSKGYMPVSSGPNMTGFDMGKTSSMMDMMQEGGLTPMSSYQRSFTRPRTPGAALLARALQKQEDLSLLEDYQRTEAERQKRGGLFGSIGGLAGGLLGAALAPVTGGASLAFVSGLGSALGSGLGQSLGAGKSRDVDRSGTVFGQQSFRDVEQASRDFTKGIRERALVSGLTTAATAGLSPDGGIYGKVSGRLNPSSISSLTEFSSGVTPTAKGFVSPSSSEFGDAIAQGTPLEGTLVDESFVDVAVPEFDTSLTDVSDMVLQPTEDAYQASLANALSLGEENALLDAARTAQTARSQAMQTSDEMQRLIDYLSRGEEIGFVPFGRNAGLPFGSFEDGGLIGMQTGGLTAEQILREQGLTADDKQLALFQAFDPTGVQRATESAGQSLLDMTGGQGLASAGGGFGAQQSAISQMVEQGQKSLEQQIQEEQKAFESQTLGTAADIVAGGGEFGTYGGSGTAFIPPGAPPTPEQNETYNYAGTEYVWNGTRWVEVEGQRDDRQG